MSRASSPTKSEQGAQQQQQHQQQQEDLEDMRAPVSYANFDHLKIAVRERPLGDGEAANVQVVLRTDQEKLIAFYPSSKEGLVYNYDHFYPAESTQSDIFHTIGDEMVSLAVNGFSTTFIGVGPSSAGKTHTLFGSDQEAGLVQHVTREIFNQAAATNDQVEWTIKAQYFEVNGDDICDALSTACSPTAAAVIGVTPAQAFAKAQARADTNASASSQALNSHLTSGAIGATGGGKSAVGSFGSGAGGGAGLMDDVVRLRRDNKFGGYSVCGIEEVKITTWDELDVLLLNGNNRRIQLAEKRRARWHGFVRLYIERVPKLAPTTATRCVVTFVHTKGPERVGEQGTRGEQMTQGSRLNKSLSLLGSAVLHCADFRRKALKDALAAGKNISDPQVLGDIIDRSQSFFMESKFTMLIGNAMCGRCATFMLGCVATTNYHDCTDTLETLQNAQQLTSCVPTRCTITQFGKLQRQLERAENKCGSTTAAKLAPGHPLTEIEEKVERLRQKMQDFDFESAASTEGEDVSVVSKSQLMLTATERRAAAAARAASKIEGEDEGQPRRAPPPAPVSVPHTLQKWKQDTLKAKMHGNRATVYIPSRRGEKEYDTYKGDWARGLKDGYGEHVTDTTKYLGEWSGGLREGHGTLWIRDKKGDQWRRVYKGEWKQGLRWGYGMQWCDNGETYEGNFECDKRHDVGKLFLPNGDCAEGQFANGHVHGWACLYCKNKDWFEGRWFEGLREGPGVWHYVTKQQKYKGTWHKGIAKCGEVFDTKEKAVNTTSTFLPVCRLAKPEDVLAKMKEQLEQIRSEEFGVSGFEKMPHGPTEADAMPTRPSPQQQQGETLAWN